MSGHSKWSQIKHQKSATDAKKGMAFTKLSYAISMAVKEGGHITDPNQNFHLRLAIEKARKFNMPKANIERAIQRGQGKVGDIDNLEEVIYEGFGPGNVAIIMQATTDNRQRTISSLRSLFLENNGHLAGPGSVSYLFKKVGALKIKKKGMNEDDYTELALNSGCLDVEDLGEVLLFYIDVVKAHQLKEIFEKQGLEIIDSEIIFRPTMTIKIEDREVARKLLHLMSQLEDNEDIHKVAANFDIPDHLINI